MLTRPPQHVFDALVRVFRTQEQAGERISYSQAAAITGVDVRTARRAWQRGWEDMPPVLPPIKEMLHREKLEARAALEKARRKTIKIQERNISTAREDAELSRAFEAFASRKALVASEQLVSDAAQMLHAAKPVREKLVQLMHDAAADPDVSIGKLLALQRQLAEYSEIAVKTLEKAMVIEHRRLGRPDLIIKNEGPGAVPVDEQTAFAMVKGFFEAAERWSTAAKRALPAQVIPVTLETPAIAPVESDED